MKIIFSQCANVLFFAPGISTPFAKSRRRSNYPRLLRWFSYFYSAFHLGNEEKALQPACFCHVFHDYLLWYLCTLTNLFNDPLGGVYIAFSM